MNTLQDDEKLKLQEKLGKKIRQYKNLIEMVRDVALEATRSKKTRKLFV